MSGERRIPVGRIVGVHGVQGWIKLESHTDPRRNIFRY
ncbi:MAG: ribosome maturation factor RimM, partial [Gammaproteobacteria bacterium]|nr:ribosome maturation factor RimM [Gammaproteobacteria bacterium]